MVQMIPSNWINEYYGLSTDDKPDVYVPNGSLFYEMDTGELAMYDAENKIWIPQ